MATKRRSDGMLTLSADYIMEALTVFYVFVMLCIYPLYFRNRYFDMGESKFLFFKWFSMVGFGVITAAWIFRIFAHVFTGDKNEVSFEKAVKGAYISDYLVIAYLLVTWVSFLLTDYTEMAVWGFEGWNMGFYSQVFFVLIYFFVSRFWKKNEFTLIAALAVAVFTFQFTILQRFGFDPMGMYVGVATSSLEKFVSTLGQTSWFSSYAVLMVPFGFYYYIYDKRSTAKALALCFVSLSFGMLVTTHSDSAYIAFAFILLVFFCFAMRSNEKMFRFLEAFIMGLFSMRFVGWMNAGFPERVQKTMIEEEKLTKIATSSTPMLILLIASIIIYSLFRFVLCKDRPWEKKEEKPQLRKPVQTGNKVKSKQPAAAVPEQTETEETKGFDISKYAKPVTIALIILLFAGIACIVLCVVLVTNGTISSGPLAKVDYFHYGDGWGNHRGFNWRMAIRAFKNSSLKDLLVGVGPDCFAGAMNKYCQPDVSIYWSGLTLACAHNEFFNMLVTEGFLGVMAYLGIFISCFVRFCKNASKDELLIPLAAAIPAYVGHNFFCYQQCICTPVIFILMAMGMRIVFTSGKRE